MELYVVLLKEMFREHSKRESLVTKLFFVHMGKTVFPISQTRQLSS